jgi:hypothetical protein
MASKSEILHTMRSAAPNIGDATHTTVMNALRDAGHIRVDDDPVRAASDIVGAMRASGERGVVLTPAMAATADPHRNPVLLRQVRAACARVGYNLKDDERVDLPKLNACLKEANADIDTRMRVKEILHAMHLIEH